MMHQKAYFKNEEEFSYAMLSYTNQNGRLVKTKDHLKPDELKLLDSQDARYIGMREQADKKHIEKRSGQLHFLDAPGGPKRHVLFLDDEDADKPSMTPSASSSSVPVARSRKKNALQDYDV